MTILTVIGTRPEAIKMAPVLCELARHTGRVRSLLCVTGQHRDLVTPILDLFGLRPDFTLQVMTPGQSLAQLTAALCTQLDPVLEEAGPDWVLGQGDTTTALAAALVACYHRVLFGHVEAGLRTGDKFSPWPEELNRRVADLAADLLFAPTAQARRNLLREGCPADKIHVTGNTVVDAVQEIAARPAPASFPHPGFSFATPARNRRLVLVTAHRRESFGAPLREICAAVRDLAGRFPAGDLQFILPVHPNPAVRLPVQELLVGISNVLLVEPLDYHTMVHLMKRACLILTDSGGIQEEGPSLGVPVVVLRETTERPEGVAAGLVRLAGTRRDAIIDATLPFLAAPLSQRPSGRRLANPYGDGRAAQRIVSLLLGPGRSRTSLQRAANPQETRRGLATRTKSSTAASAGKQA